MTLLKRLQEEAREEYEKENKEDNVNVYRVLDITTANTVTAVLNEIERKVEIAQGANTENTMIGLTAQFLVNDAFTDIKAIISNLKRTEV